MYAWEFYGLTNILEKYYLLCCKNYPKAFVNQKINS